MTPPRVLASTLAIRARSRARGHCGTQPGPRVPVFSPGLNAGAIRALRCQRGTRQIARLRGAEIMKWTHAWRNGLVALERDRDCIRDRAGVDGRRRPARRRRAASSRRPRRSHRRRCCAGRGRRKRRHVPRVAVRGAAGRRVAVAATTTADAVARRARSNAVRGDVPAAARDRLPGSGPVLRGLLVLERCDTHVASPCWATGTRVDPRRWFHAGRESQLRRSQARRPRRRRRDHQLPTRCAGFPRPSRRSPRHPVDPPATTA